VLQVGRRVGLDDAVGVAQELDDLVEVRVSPVDAGYACRCRKLVCFHPKLRPHMTSLLLARIVYWSEFCELVFRAEFMDKVVCRFHQ
jgi:hypothetical protein